MSKKLRGSWTIGSWEILPDWRPTNFKPKKRRFVQSQASVGLTRTQRIALERASRTSELSMAEVVRRCLEAGGICASNVQAAPKSQRQTA